MEQTRFSCILFTLLTFIGPFGAAWHFKTHFLRLLGDFARKSEVERPQFEPLR